MSPDAETEVLLTPWQREVVAGITAWCDAHDVACERMLLRQFTRLGPGEQVTVQLTLDDVMLVVAADCAEMLAHNQPQAWIGHGEVTAVLTQLTVWLDGA